MKNNSYSSMQMAALVGLRILVGWHLLFEGISKLMNPHWTSVGFLKESKWILEGFAQWVISNPGATSAVDFLNTWGLIAIGLGLILGFLSKAASISGIVLLLTYYCATPPLIGIEYSVPFEGNYLIVNKNLIEAAALFVLVLFPTSSVFGLDMFLSKVFQRKKGE